MSWPPVLQGTAEREMIEAVEPAASSGLSGVSSIMLASSSVLWFPSDSLKQQSNKMIQIKGRCVLGLFFFGGGGFEGWAQE